MDSRSFVVSISGRASPKLESVKIPTSLPVKYAGSNPISRNTNETIGVESRSPNDIK